MNPTADNEGRIRYDESFKLEALRRWKTTGRSASAVAKELGISSATLYIWGREARTNGSESSVAVTGRLLREMEQEISRLREENDKLRQQREILKKSLAILSEPHRAAQLSHQSESSPSPPRR